MSAFRVSAGGLLRLATQGALADRIAEQVWRSGHGVSPAERKSWSRSLSVLAQDLADAGLDDVEVLVEYRLPLTSRRIDAVLAGTHPNTGETRWCSRRPGSAPASPTRCVSRWAARRGLAQR